MSLDWVLHARYMTPSVDRATNNYGGQDVGSSCNAINRREFNNTSNTADVSRNTFSYFSSNPSVYLAGAPSGLGGMDGTVEDSNGNKQAVNRAVNFLGKDYVLIGDRIYSYVEESGVWVSSLSLTGKTAASTSSLGLYPVSINSTPYLVTAWSVGNGTTWRFAKLNGDTQVWTTSDASDGGLGINDANGGILTEVQHDDKIYYTTSSNTSFGWFDYVIGSFGSNTFGTTSRHPMDFCSFMGNLYILNKNTTDNVQVLKAVGSTTAFELLLYDTGIESDISGVFIGDTLTTTNQFEGRPLFFVDNVYDSGNVGQTPTLWAYYSTNAELAAGWAGGETQFGLFPAALRLDDNGDLFDASILPGMITGFRANPFKMAQNQEATEVFPINVQSRKDEDIVLRVFVDQKDRGIAGDIHGDGKSSIVCASRFAGQGCLSFGAPGGGGDFNNLFYHIYKGSGNAAGGTHPDSPTKGGGAHAFQFLGYPAKGTRHRAFPHERLGGGARHSEHDTDGERIADIVFRGTEFTSEPGIIRINYSIIPSTGNPFGSAVDVRWWHDKNSHSPETPCTPTGTSEGAISGLLAANVIVDPDKTYFFDWAAQDDGLQRFQKYTLNGQINLATEAIQPLNNPSGLSDLLSWFEADDESTIVSGITGNVSEWRDKAEGISGVIQSNSSFQPTYILEANNTLGGVLFTAANSEYLFASGEAPISGQSATICVIYEPASATSNFTIFSLSNNLPSGVVTSHEYWSITTISDQTATLSDRDSFAGQDRTLVIPSGGIPDNTRLLVWKNIPFEGIGQLFPSGQRQETEITVDGNIEATGLSNTTFGRFSGAQISGVYNDAGRHFDGTIYEIAIYNRILADVEVSRFQLYAENKYNLDD